MQSLAFHGGLALIEDVGRHRGWASGGAAVLVFFEELDDSRAALLIPRLRVGDLFSVGEEQRVGELVTADGRLIIVGGDAGDDSGRRACALRERGAGTEQDEGKMAGTHADMILPI